MVKCEVFIFKISRVAASFSQVEIRAAIGGRAAQCL
jgi:hypothetical protein